MAVRKKKKKAKKRRGSASLGAGHRRAKNWDKAVSVAYLRLIGKTQEESAKDAGCAQRSIAYWERSPWWREAQAEAHQRWLRGGDAQVRDRILIALRDPKEYATTARWWADRRIPELAPPKMRGELTGEGGGPVRVSHSEEDLSALSVDELKSLRSIRAKLDAANGGANGAEPSDD